MMTLLVRLSLVLLILNQFLTPADAGPFWARTSGKSKEPGKTKTLVANSAGLPSQNTARRGLGISAWGIVILVVAIVLAGMGFYYFSMCYSICQPSQGKYDKMGMPTIA